MTAESPSNPEAWARQVYDAFNAHDIEGCLALMHTDVEWPNGWEGGYVRGHEAVREYWTRQFAAIRVRVLPVSVATEADGRLRVEVDQARLDESGQPLEQHIVHHVYRFRAGLVDHMEIQQGRSS